MEEITTKKIVKESLRFLVIAAIIATIGGVGLKGVEGKLLVLLPFLIVFPALNNAAGDFAIIMVSRVSTYLYARKGKDHQFRKKESKHLFLDILPVALLLTAYLSIIATAISSFSGFRITYIFYFKFLLTLLSVMMVLFLINFFIAILAGRYIYNKGANPDDVLIPITTSISDLGGLLTLALLIGWLF